MGTLSTGCQGPLESAGRVLYDARAAFMVEAGQGLTRTYNAVKDAAITDAAVEGLRALHLAVDRAVLAAYGWSDLEPPPCTNPRSDFDDEIIDRLFALNSERAAAECGHKPRRA